MSTLPLRGGVNFECLFHLWSDCLGGDRRSIFSGIESLARRRSALLQIIDGPNPLEIQVQKILSPTEAVIGDRRTKLFGTNNYLGMTFEPEVRQAAIDAIETSGV